MIDLDAVPARLGLPSERGPAPTAPPLGSDGHLHAAVSVVLRPAEGGPDLLLIKRAAAERDPWSGHMAFPGGKHEPADAHLLDTSRRETLEETGLALSHEPPGWVGRLPGVSPRGPGSERLPSLTVTPFLFRVPADAEARVTSAEVEAVHWIALSELVDPGREGLYRVPIGEAIRSFPAIDIAGEQIWGLTWRVLTELVTRLGLREAVARDATS